MQYEKQILEAFERLEFTPRPRQVEDINQIIVAFLDEGHKTVVLSAPTGTGKSIIGAVVAETLHQIRHPDAFGGASFLLTPTNILSEQYHRTFQDGRDPNDTRFWMIKGAGNFECAALSTPTEPQTAEVCSIRLFHKEGMQSMIDTFCNGCEYSHMKRHRDRARHLITNYSYYFIDRMYTNQMAKRTVCVFDETHMINDLFTEHNAIYFSDSRLQKMVQEINEALSLGHTDIFKSLKTIREHLQAGKINRENYLKYLELLASVYYDVHEAANEAAEREIRNPKKYLQLSKLSKKYFGLGCKIGDLMEYEYPHAFEYKERDPKFKDSEDEVSVKPIFVGDMFETLENAEFNLLMSATFSKQYAMRTLTLPNSKYIRLAPSFPKENKKVVFYKPQNLNFNSLKDPKTVKQLQATCYEIVKHHTDKGERGIILAPSFILTRGVSAALSAMKVPTKIFEHIRGDKLSVTLERFKQHSGPAVLLTPSGFEGLDLAGDLSRFQIIVKAPFGSLGEARMKHILDIYPDVYNLLCLMKIVQGAGRSVRGPEDWATTYCLDTNIQRVWTAKTNEWTDEFSTTFTSLLSVE